MRITFFQTHRSFSAQRPSRFISLAIRPARSLPSSPLPAKRGRLTGPRIWSPIFPGPPDAPTPTSLTAGGLRSEAAAPSGWRTTGPAPRRSTTARASRSRSSSPFPHPRPTRKAPTRLASSSIPARVLSFPKEVVSGPSAFIFVSEDGSISGWSPAVALDHAIIAVDDGKEGSVYKGAALGESSSGLRLFVTNFSEGKVSIYDDTFAEIDDDAAFVDPNIPSRLFALWHREYQRPHLRHLRQARPDGKDDVPGQGARFLRRLRRGW